jgi:hypothetical protein
MGWKPRGILSPKLGYLPNPLIPGLVSRKHPKILVKQHLYRVQSFPSNLVFFTCFQHKNSTVAIFLKWKPNIKLPSTIGFLNSLYLNKIHTIVKLIKQTNQGGERKWN